jgi:hypothetical protein
VTGGPEGPNTTADLKVRTTTAELNVRTTLELNFEDVMTELYEVITAFVDGERVDPEELKRALSEAAGRDYLVDIIALRAIVVAHEPATVARARVRYRPLRWLAAAAVLFGIGGGLFFTWTHADRPPRPDHIVKLERGLDWRGE